MLGRDAAVRARRELGGVSSSPAFILCKLVVLAERFEKLPAMLATLSFLITEDAEARTMCSLLDRTVMPGKGKTSRVQTSESIASSLARSPRDGASTGIRSLVASKDCDRLIEAAVVNVELSLTTLVFLRMTWHKGDFGPTVVARCIDILLATVPDD